MPETPLRPPGPAPLGRNPLTLLKFYREFSRDPIGIVGRRFAAHGDVYFTVSRGDPLFVLRHPDHVQQVLVQRASSFDKRQDLEPFLGRGLLNSNGEAWRRQRRLIQPSFSRERLESYCEVFVNRTERMLSRWNAGQVIDLGASMMQLTLEIVGKTLFDHEVEDDVAEISEAIQMAQEMISNPLPPWVPTPGRRRYQSAQRRLHSHIARLIEQKRAQDVAGEDLLAQLLLAKDEAGGMSEDLLKDELITLFVAGHETTSLVLTWLFFLLSKHPEAEARVFEEVDRVLGGRRPGPKDVEALEYTGRALDEAMRLYPPAYVLARLARERTEIAGYTLEPGAEVVIWLYHMHHDERWFPNPEAFDPDRFRPDSGAVKHPHAYLPFGAGARTCIGKHFARFEALLVASTIAQTYRLVGTDTQPVAPRPRITLGPDRPIHLRLECRGT